MSSRMCVVVASIIPDCFSQNCAQIRRRQLGGTRIASYATQTAQYLVSEASSSFSLWNGYNATEADQFSFVLRNLLNRLRSATVSGDSLRKFAAAYATGPSSLTIYGLMQCTPDLSEQECSDCLDGALRDIIGCCDNQLGRRVVVPSCKIRYETYNFFEPTAAVLPHSPPQESSPPPPSTNRNNTPGKNSTSRTVIIIVVSVVVFVLLLVLICIYLRLRKPKAETDDKITTNESLQFDFDTIQVATNNFADSNKLGQGGFGVVYRVGSLVGKRLLSKGCPGILAKEIWNLRMKYCYYPSYSTEI